MIGLPHLPPREVCHQGAHEGRRDVKEAFHHVGPPVIVEPAACHEDPVEMLLREPAECPAVGALAIAQVCVHAALRELVQILLDELRVGDDAAVGLQIGQLAFGRLARIRLLDHVEVELQRRQQHLDLQAEGADVAQAEGRAKGVKGETRGGHGYLL